MLGLVKTLNPEDKAMIPLQFVAPSGSLTAVKILIGTATSHPRPPSPDKNKRTKNTELTRQQKENAEIMKRQRD